MKVKRLGTEEKWELLEDYRVTEDIIIPAGFITDFGSVPEYLRWLIPKRHPKLDEGYLSHDYLYREDRSKGRRFADDMQFAIHWADGAPRWMTLAIYTVVRVFGQKRWNELKNQEL